MEDSASAHNSTSNAQCKLARANKISQKFSSLRGIIRIPVKRSRLGDNSNIKGNAIPPEMQLPSDDGALGLQTDFGQRHPYGSVSSSGVKPYMSQPMLANGLVHVSVGKDDLEGRRSLDFAESVFEATGGLRTATAGRLGPPMRGSASPKPLGPPTNSISSAQNSAAHLDKRANGCPHRAGPSHTSRTLKKKSTHSKSISSALVDTTTQTGFAFVGVKVDVEVGANVDINDESGSIGCVANDVANRSLEPERSLIGSTRTAHSVTGAGLDSENGIRSQEMLPSADISETTHPNSVECVGAELSNPHAILLERKPSSIFKPLPDLPGEILMTAGPASSSRSMDSASIDVDNKMSSTAAIMSNDSVPTSTVGNVHLTAGMSASIPTINIIHNTTSTVTTSTMTTPTPNDATTTFIIDGLQNETDLPKLFTTAFPPKRSISTGAPLPTQKPLRLSLSALNRRLSFGITEGSARLSPRIIIRPPPLPLINLPVLTTPGGSRMTATIPEMAEDRDGRNERRQSRLGLRSIPALPLQGSSRGARGHEEVDDLEEDDEDDDEDEDEDEDDREINRSSAEATGRSFDSERSTDDDDNDIVVEKLSVSVPTRTSSRTSSYVTARAEPSPTISDSYFGNGSTRLPEQPFSKTPQSPPVDASAFKLDFSLVIDQEPSSGPSENTRLSSPGELLQMGGSVDKGKARQKDEEVIIGNVLTGRTLDSQDYGYGHRDRGVVDRAQVDRSKVVGVSGERRVVGCSGPHLFPSNPVIPGGFRTGGGDYSRYSVLPPSPRPRPEMPVPCGVLSTSGEESPAMTTPLPRQPNLESVSITTKASKLSVDSGVGITQHAGIYKRASQSLVDVRAIQTKEMVQKMVKDHEREEERKRAVRTNMKVLGVPQRGFSGVDEEKRMVQEVNNSQPSLSGESTLHKREEDASDTTTFRSSMIDEKGSLHPLRRRCSMPTSTPPPYSSLPFHPYGGLKSPPTILPHEDEGMEKLPPYTNGIYLRAIMPRKMEFSSLGVQAKDRKWRRVLCVLEGTVFKVYKCTPSAAGVSSIGGWWESKVGVGDSSADSGNQVASPTAQDRNSSAPAWDVEPARAKNDGDESGNGNGQPALERSDPTEQLQLSSPPPQRKHYGHNSSHSLGVIPTTKSALTFAVQLLKPQARHTRSNSDLAVRTPQAQSPRSSLNIPRSGRSTPATSNHGSVSLRSPSPTASSSTHISTPPSSAVLSQPSRPSTPALSGNERRTTAGCKDNSSSASKDKTSSVDMAEPIRVYTMQHAESGLGKDYTKRQHVIRVRLEGEQFLIQAKGVDDVIAWIEGFQAAANVALDLDERPMPTGPLFPRRRRRRRAGNATTTVGLPPTS